MQYPSTSESLIKKKPRGVRFNQLHEWCAKVLPVSTFTLQLLAGDASFRRYFRVQAEAQTWVVMDAPPDNESLHAFLALAKCWREADIQVPSIVASDVEQGFVLLTDFGDQLLLNVLTETNVDQFYQQAMQDLLHIMRCNAPTDYELPLFGPELLLAETELYSDWYVRQWCGIKLNRQEKLVLKQAQETLITAALQQPQVCVHRDYHSRNIIVLPDNTLGIIDFQDAVKGPITYDILSLLRDCYIDWPSEQVIKWMLSFQKMLLEQNVLQEEDPAVFSRWFDWIGLQRHLKCIGIFSRLCQRDNKPNYLQYIPRIQDYALQVCNRYSALHPLGELMQRVGVKL